MKPIEALTRWEVVERYKRLKKVNASLRSTRSYYRQTVSKKINEVNLLIERIKKSL